MKVVALFSIYGCGNDYGFETIACIGVMKKGEKMLKCPRCGSRYIIPEIESYLISYTPPMDNKEWYDLEKNKDTYYICKKCGARIKVKMVLEVEE